MASAVLRRTFGGSKYIGASRSQGILKFECGEKLVFNGAEVARVEHEGDRSFGEGVWPHAPALAWNSS
jgi:hypothetical protein